MVAHEQKIFACETLVAATKNFNVVHKLGEGGSRPVYKATSGGAYKFADLFEERLGVSPDKEDEMTCLVAGANFLLKVDLIFKIICFSCILFKNHLDSGKSLYISLSLSLSLSLTF